MGVNSNREIRVRWAVGNVGLELLRDLSEEPPVHMVGPFPGIYFIYCHSGNGS